MGKIIISQNVTIDGVAEDSRGWFGGFKGRDYEEWAKVETGEALSARALLLGRRTDEWFAKGWTSRTGEWADRLNSMPKYVVSSTLEHPAWSNTTVLKGDVVNEVTKLKRELAGEIVVYGSRQLVGTLMEHDLADELRLTVHPVVLGAGERLFGETSGKKPMRLLGARTLGDGLTYLTYELARDA
jgi:dihydrofolate reductase